MRLPFIDKTIKSSRKTIHRFYGLNTGKVIADNEFKNMSNMTSLDYPIIRTREPRIKTKNTYQGLNAIMHKDGLFYIANGLCYYKGEQINGMYGWGPNVKRELLSFGAYILIFPDKIIFNTKTKKIRQLEIDIRESGRIIYEPLIGDSSFTKILIPNSREKLNDFFQKHDTVSIRCSHFNKTTTLHEVGSNFIVISGKVAAREQEEYDAIVIKRAFPEFDYMCESQNRVWLCNSAKREIYASKLGDPFNFQNFEGIDSDSYSATVGSEGDFTGCIGHNGYVLFFKERQILKMFGNNPSNFQLSTYDYTGVKKGCHKTLTMANESLYYVGSDGAVYLYDGAIPIKISEKISAFDVSGAMAFYQNNTLYISENKPRANCILAYNMAQRIWTLEDGASVKHGYYKDGEVYYVDESGQERKLIDKENASKEVIPWFLESGKSDEGTLYNKYISKLIFHIRLAKGAKLEIKIRYDDEPMYTKLLTVQSNRDKTISIPIIPKRCQSFQYRLEGKGGFWLLGIARNINEGSEV